MPAKDNAISTRRKAIAKPSRDADKTKASLLEAAERLFAQHGFKGVTVDALTKASGVNRAMISYYFGSKEGLYDAVITALVRDVADDVRRGRDDAHDPAAGLRNYIQCLARAFARRPALGAILLREYMEGRMQEREKPLREVLQFYQMTEALYKAGRRRKQFRKLDPHQLHFSIISPLLHFVLTIGFRDRALSQHAANLSNPSVDKFAEHHASLILQGIAFDERTPPSGRSN